MNYGSTQCLQWKMRWNRGILPISQVSLEFCESLKKAKQIQVWKCLVWFLWGHQTQCFSVSLSQDYLGCIIDCGDLPLKPEEVSTLFCNIEDIYEFNRLVSSFFQSSGGQDVCLGGSGVCWFFFFPDTMTGLCPALSHREGQCADVCQEQAFAVSVRLQQTVPGLL